MCFFDWLSLALSFVKQLLSGEQDLPGQHAGHAGDLFLLMHQKVSWNIVLEVKGHLPTNLGQNGEDVPGICFSLQHMTECLYEPTASSGMSPTQESWDSAVCYQKVCMIWYFI